ncbi:hypothetical protein B0T16DRAFT_205644 [Cercophora newfieldiana]|uniref:Uncharacterized protein n=1 Tax=Cercophora newfieldiana TaxID=92897 RepID=A0AA40CL25_9PEZI|nr:hypothetical protein B0T16DRAFT_205644 [Cercophora newfieldiana]
MSQFPSGTLLIEACRLALAIERPPPIFCGVMIQNHVAGTPSVRAVRAGGCTDLRRARVSRGGALTERDTTHHHAALPTLHTSLSTFAPIDLPNRPWRDSSTVSQRSWFSTVRGAWSPQLPPFGRSRGVPGANGPQRAQTKKPGPRQTINSAVGTPLDLLLASRRWIDAPGTAQYRTKQRQRQPAERCGCRSAVPPVGHVGHAG